MSQTVSVSNRSELYAALQNPSGPTTILLAPGDYGPVRLVQNVNFSYHVTIKSADIANPAVIETLTIRNKSNITLDNLRFEDQDFFSPTTTSLNYLALLRTDNVSDLVVTNSTFVGPTIDIASGHYLNGYAYGHGWKGSRLTNVIFTNNEMTNLDKGVSISNLDNVNISNNDIHDYRQDALYISTANKLVVDGNRMANVNAYTLPNKGGDHPDFMQLNNITNSQIQNNYMDVGTAGGFSQGIFSGAASNLIVSNNIIITPAVNAIQFSALTDSVISNNLVLQSQIPAGGLSYADGQARPAPSPQIRALGKFDNVVMQDNISHGYSFHFESLASGGKFTSVNNVEVQNVNPSAPDYYGYLAGGGGGAAGAPASGLVPIGSVLIDQSVLSAGGPNLSKFAYIFGNGAGGAVGTPPNSNPSVPPVNPGVGDPSSATFPEPLALDDLAFTFTESSASAAVLDAGIYEAVQLTPTGGGPASGYSGAPLELFEGPLATTVFDTSFDLAI